MKHDDAWNRNIEPSYDLTMPSRDGILPDTALRVIGGVERGKSYVPNRRGLFENEVRHYNLVARPVSAQTVTLCPLTSAELEGAVRLACGSGAVDLHHGVPSPAVGSTFQALREADLFDGGSLSVLTPGVFSVGDTVVDVTTGRIFLELRAADGKQFFAVIGVFRDGHPPACVDWRVITAPARAL